MTNDKYDLHCHSTASDGTLPPEEVVRRAHGQGVTVLALTDHDTTAGLERARREAESLGMVLINGVELSANYRNQCLHIIGLNIDPKNCILAEGMAKQQALRGERAKKIAAKLEKIRIPEAYPAVRFAAGNGEITRSHFADFLAVNGYVANQQEAFDRYLSRGKPAYVPTLWAELSDVVAWIKAAGGVAVLAHPLRYKLSGKWLGQALAEFKDLGGEGIEVVTGRAGAEEIRISRELAARYRLHASLGSDFHSPEFEWLELGRLAKLPEGLQPIWELF